MESNTRHGAERSYARSVLDEVKAQIVAMHERDIIDGQTAESASGRSEGIVVPEQPSRCPACGYYRGHSETVSRPTGLPEDGSTLNRRRPR